MASRKAYVYEPLPADDVIRILVIHPSADPAAKIECHLTHARLSAQLDNDKNNNIDKDDIDNDNDNNDDGYTALSYVWGSEEEEARREIHIGDDCALHIWPNLESALRHVRRRDIALRIWADALCINQHDTQERNHQVQQMRSIYARARSTVIYLGDNAGNTCSSAWNFLERSSRLAMDAAGDMSAAVPAAMQRLSHFRGDLDDVEIDVLSRPWFRRVWVFQEAVVSRRLFVQCGARRISWDDFCQVLFLSPRYVDQYGARIRWVDHIEIVLNIFQARCAFLAAHGAEAELPAWSQRVNSADAGHGNGRDLSLLRLLQMARQLQSSDHRDKLYALLGIATHVDLADSRLEVDYSKACTSVYRDFAHYHIEKTGSYDVLSYTFRGSTMHSSSSLAFGNRRDTDESLDLHYPSTVPSDIESVPSWAPDWSSTGNYLLIPRTVLSTLADEDESRSQARQKIVRASYTWKSALRTPALRCTGVKLGEIVSISNPIWLKGKDEVVLQQIWDDDAQSSAGDVVKTRREVLSVLLSLLPVDLLQTDAVRILDRLEPTIAEDDSRNRRSRISRVSFRRSPRPGSEERERRLAAILLRDKRRSVKHRLELAQENGRSPLDDTATMQDWLELFCTADEPPPDSVEAHLLKRAHKTVLWSRDESKAVDVVVDKTSIVDGKSIAVYRDPASNAPALALVPGTADIGDQVVYLKGARVPYVARLYRGAQHGAGERRWQREEPTVLQSLTAKLGPKRWSLIGECVANGFGARERECFALREPSTMANEERFAFE